MQICFTSWRKYKLGRMIGFKNTLPFAYKLPWVVLQPASSPLMAKFYLLLVGPINGIFTAAATLSLEVSFTFAHLIVPSGQLDEENICTRE